MKKALIFWFSFLLILLLASCGVRKSSVNIDDKKIENTQSDVVQNNVTTDINANVEENKVIDSTSDVVTEKTTYTPVDNSKPATFTDDTGKAHTLNNTSFIKEKTTAKTNKKSTSVTKSAVSDKIKDLGTKKSNSSTKESEHKKAKDTFNFPLWWLWFLLLIPVGYYAWKNKDKFFI
jgi:hypothetical protein